MNNQKKIGSYYTPKNLADFMVDYCLSQLNMQIINVLEPSVGDGMFVSSINDSNLTNYLDAINLTIVEREEKELNNCLNNPHNLLSKFFFSF